MEPNYFVDYYEALQISPNADADTIHRIYRILAQRYHPDNQQTGNLELFRTLTEAYRALADPEKRAAYDVQHREARRLTWKIFDQSTRPRVWRPSAASATAFSPCSTASEFRSRRSP